MVNVCIIPSRSGIFNTSYIGRNIASFAGSAQGNGCETEESDNSRTTEEKNAGSIKALQQRIDALPDTVTLDGRGLTGRACYSLSNNGDINITGSYGILSAPGAYAFEEYHWPVNGYSSVHVTVNTTGSIEGKIQYSSDGCAGADVVKANTALT